MLWSYKPFENIFTGGIRQLSIYSWRTRLQEVAHTITRGNSNDYRWAKEIIDKNSSEAEIQFGDRRQLELYMDIQ